MDLVFVTPQEMTLVIAKRLKDRRLGKNLSQKSLSERSGVSLSTLKNFEHTGQISLKSLLKLAVVLESFESFDSLFTEKKIEEMATLNELLKDRSRKRGRL